MRERAPGLVETIWPNPLPLAALTRFLRALIEDGIPLGHPLPILAALSGALQQTTEHDRLVELVRAELGAMIVGRLCGPGERLPVVTLDARLEGAIAQGLLRLRAPGCPVLSIAELPESQPVEVIAVIGGDPPPAPALAAPDMSVSTRAHSTFEGLPA